MDIDRQFLNYFWDLSSNDLSSCNKTFESIDNYLKNIDKDKFTKYFSYCLERLVKGLTSISHISREAFHHVLIKLVKKHKDILKSAELYKLALTHVYSFSPSTEKEKNAYALAVNSILDIFLIKNSFEELPEQSLETFFKPLRYQLTKPTYQNNAVITLIKIYTSQKYSISSEIFDLINKLPDEFKNLFFFSLRKVQSKFFENHSIKIPSISKPNKAKELCETLLKTNLDISKFVIINSLSDENFKTLWSALQECCINSPKDQLHLRFNSFFNILGHVLENIEDKKSFDIKYLLFSPDLLKFFHSTEDSKLFKRFCDTLINLSIKYRNSKESIQIQYFSQNLEIILRTSPLLDLRKNQVAKFFIEYLLDSFAGNLSTELLICHSKRLIEFFVDGKFKEKSLIAHELGPETPGNSWDTMRCLILNEFKLILFILIERYEEKGVSDSLEEFLNFLTLFSCKDTTFSERVKSTAWNCLIDAFARMIQMKREEKFHKSSRNILENILKQFSDIKRAEFIRNRMDEIIFIPQPKDESNLFKEIRYLQSLLLLFFINEKRFLVNKEDLMRLLDDLTDCRKNYEESLKKPSKSKKRKSIQADTLSWQLVLFDVLISVLNIPSILLRKRVNKIFKLFIAEINKNEMVSNFNKSEMVSIIMDQLMERNDLANTKKDEKCEDDSEEGEEEEQTVGETSAKRSKIIQALELDEDVQMDEDDIDEDDVDDNYDLELANTLKEHMDRRKESGNFEMKQESKRLADVKTKCLDILEIIILESNDVSLIIAGLEGLAKLTSQSHKNQMTIFVKKAHNVTSGKRKRGKKTFKELSWKNQAKYGDVVPLDQLHDLINKMVTNCDRKRQLASTADDSLLIKQSFGEFIKEFSSAKNLSPLFVNCIGQLTHFLTIVAKNCGGTSDLEKLAVKYLQDFNENPRACIKASSLLESIFRHCSSFQLTFLEKSNFVLTDLFKDKENLQKNQAIPKLSLIAKFLTYISPTVTREKHSIQKLLESLLQSLAQILTVADQKSKLICDSLNISLIEVIRRLETILAHDSKKVQIDDAFLKFVKASSYTSLKNKLIQIGSDGFVGSFRTKEEKKQAKEERSKRRKLKKELKAKKAAEYLAAHGKSKPEAMDTPQDFGKKKKMKTDASKIERSSKFRSVNRKKNKQSKLKKMIKPKGKA